MLKIIVNKDLFLDMIYVSIVASIIATEIIQKVKETFNLSQIFNRYISLILSFIIGFFYSLSFYSPDILCSIWIGIYTLAGAEGIYKTFKGKIGLNSLDDINKKE